MRAIAATCLSALLALLSASCSTQVIRQTNDFAEAGKAYATAMDALSAYVLDEEVDDRYNMLAGYRREPKTEVAFFEERLKTVTGDAEEYSRNIGRFRVHTKKLGDYFEALNDLVDANLKDSGVAATKNAAEGLQLAGKQLKLGFGDKISDAQVTAAANLGGIIFTEIHGSVVKGVLERDGALIAREIALQELALDEFSKTLKRFEDKDRFLAYKRELRDVYVKDADKGVARPALPSDFKTKWSAYVKEHAVAAQLVTARDAADKMQKAWRSVLEGRPNMSDVLAESGKLLSAAEQAKALHEGR